LSRNASDPIEHRHGCARPQQKPRTREIQVFAFPGLLLAHRGTVKKNFHREHENQEMEVEDTKNPDYQDTARFTTLQKNANTIIEEWPISF